jgi:hypothetical protein
MTGQKYNQRYYIDSTITRAVHFFVFFFSYLENLFGQSFYIWSRMKRRWMLSISFLGEGCLFHHHHKVSYL